MNETNPAIPPPPRAGAGCLGVGCLSFVAFFFFLILVCVAGLFWGIHHVRNHYSSKTPLVMSQTQNDVDDGEPTIAPPPMPPLPASPNATPDAQSEASPTVAATTTVDTRSTQQRWNAFEKAAKHGERAHIELTAEEINALIGNSKDTRGKAFVRIENNVGYLTVSVPLEDIVFMNGRYLNGQATVKAAPDGDTAKVQITDVKVGNESVADDFLDRRIFGWNSLRGYITGWLDDQNITSFKIEGNRVIGDAGR